jgi:hypothetical protein
MAKKQRRQCTLGVEALCMARSSNPHFRLCISLTLKSAAQQASSRLFFPWLHIDWGKGNFV